jgi:hypothetical protein
MPQIPIGPFAGWLVEGVVVNFRPAGHPQNIYRGEDEYVVRVLSHANFLDLNHCRLAQRVGYDNGQQEHLRVGTIRVDQNSNQYASKVPETSMDGDRVLVQFIEGDVNRSVITHVLTHSLNRWGDTHDSFRGAVVRRRHAGTEVLYDANGNIVVTLGDSTVPDVKGASKTATVFMDGTQAAKLEKDKLSIFNGDKAVARKDDEVTITVSAADITALGLVSPSGSVTGSGGTLKGTVTAGSAKFFTE